MSKLRMSVSSSLRSNSALCIQQVIIAQNLYAMGPHSILIGGLIDKSRHGHYSKLLVGELRVYHSVIWYTPFDLTIR